jgi:hypothetical protein
MESQTSGHADQRPAGLDGRGLEARFPGKYLSVTSFKRDGPLVSAAADLPADAAAARRSYRGPDCDARDHPSRTLTWRSVS